MFEPNMLLSVAAVFFLAAFVKGVTGLGFSTTALPFLVLTIGLKETLPLLIIPSILSNLLVMRSAGYFRVSCSQFWPLYIATLPGIVVGLILLNSFDSHTCAAVLGAVLVIYSAMALRNPTFRLTNAKVRWLQTPVGCVTGVLNGMTGSQVVPVVPKLLSLPIERDHFVQASNISFTLSSLVMSLGLTQLGLMTLETNAISSFGIILVFAGVQLGTRFRRWLSPSMFRRTVLIVLICLGSSLVFRLMI